MRKDKREGASRVKREKWFSLFLLSERKLEVPNGRKSGRRERRSEPSCSHGWKCEIQKKRRE